MNNTTIAALIEAMTIFQKHIPDVKWPTNCTHDTLWVKCPPDRLTAEEIARLDELGFCPDEFGEGFLSHRFGSC